MFDAARRKEAWALAVIDAALDYLAIMVAGVIACFDPELLVLGGGVSRSADLLLDPLLRRVEGIPPGSLPVVVSTLGNRATVLGAITTVLHNTSDYYVVHKLS